MDRPELTIDTPVAFVDVETTGGYPGLDRIIDVAVIGATGSRLDFEWQSLVNPGAPVPVGITALTGIDAAMLEDAPPFERIAKQLRERLAGRVFVAHNARFDYGFIRREFVRAGGEWRSPTLCTVRLSRALYPQMPRHNLDAVMERHNIVIEHRHRAMPDAQVLWRLWQKLRTDWPVATLQRALEAAAPRVQLPAALSADLPDELPETPGVYRFLGENDGDAGAAKLLYVGKANNLRERVLGHFHAGARDAKTLRIAAQVRRVEWTETAGELGALLLEAREIREAQPIYNRPLRGGERLTWLLESGAVPQLVPLDAQVLGTGNAFGTYRSERDARKALESLAREHQWCLKLSGLEGDVAAAGSCVGFQMGRCRGACVGREVHAVHLTRVKLGLMPLRLAPWPHAGPMVLREGFGERAQYHVIDAWQHLGTFDSAAAPAELGELARTVRRSSGRAAYFDYDAYRILTRHLRDRRLSPLPVAREDSSWPAATSDESTWS